MERVTIVEAALYSLVFDSPLLLVYPCVGLFVRTRGNAAMLKPSLEVLEDRTMPSFVLVDPSAVAHAAEKLAQIGAAIADQNAAAASPTTGILPAAADEVSAALAALFGAHGETYQTLS
jgi:hypothetical protein